MTTKSVLARTPILWAFTAEGRQRVSVERARRKRYGRRSFVGGLVTLPFRAALWIFIWPVALVRNRNRRHRAETNRLIDAIEAQAQRERTAADQAYAKGQ